MLVLRGVITIVLFYCTGCQSNSIHAKHHGNVTDGILIEQPHEKRGTIRIAGPWHSESALDRNIDPGEDSYVKKIISSNEGINFNKDIAEAGEVFDVNGIEDFYDKNAMITYEVNGHEIPVHMKPKYTPQSKSMFPEYVRESPETLGNTRQTKANAHHSPSMNERPDGRPSTFTGLSVKDMPEYNVRDSSDLSGIKEEGIHGDNRHFYHELPPPLRIQKETTHLPSLEQLAANHGISEEALAKLKVLTSKSNSKSSQETEHSIGDFAAEYLRKKLEKEDSHEKPQHAEHVDYEMKETSKTESKPVSPTDSQLKLDTTSKKTEPTSSQVEPPSTQVESALTEHPRLEAEKPHQPDQSNAFTKQERPSQAESSSEGKLFQKLQNLHEKLSEDNVALKESQQEHNDKENEPEKAKAKAKILNLLGELTNKLKGMEAVVTGHHTDKEIEKANNVEPKSSFDGQHKPADSESKYVEKVPHSQMETLRHEPIEEKVAASFNPVENSPLKIEDESFHSHDKRKKMEEYRKLTPADIYLYHHAKDTSQSSDKLSDEESARQPKISTEIIEKFSDQNKPFVMNTESIDYKPEYPTTDREPEAVSGQMTATLRSPKNEVQEKEKSQPDEYAQRKQSNDLSDESSNEKQRSDQAPPKKIKSRKNQNDYPTTPESDSRESSRESKASEGKEEKEKNTREESNRKAYEVTDNFSSMDDKGFSTSDERDREKDYVAHEKTFRPKAEDIEYPDYNEVKDAAIFETNLLRKRYHASKLRWSDRLSDEAQKEAETLSRKNDLDNNRLDSYKKPGLNIALIKLDSPNVGKEATDAWEKEVKNYDFRSPLVTKKNTDFVQLMWKGEKEFGLGVAKSKAGRGWVVTSYFDTPFVDKFQELKSNLQSDVPIEDPYQDIAG